MPSFDITSEVDMAALRNAIESASRKIGNRYDFKGTSAQIEQTEAQLVLTGDTHFQIEQMTALLLPELTAKKIDVRCLDYGDLQKIGGNKVRQEIRVRVGIEQELAKKIVKLIKDHKCKAQASIQGDSLRVTGKKRDDLQDCIALVRKEITDYPVQCGNFRD